jgi:LPS-assembly protein
MAASTTARPPSSGARVRWAAHRPAFVSAFVLVIATVGAVPAFAQNQIIENPYLNFRTQLRTAKPTSKPAPDGRMLVQADELNYDYNNDRVIASRNVQIYYKGSTLEADQVIYDKRNKRLRAEGNVRLTDSDGRISHGDTMDLSDDYRDGFVDSLRVETPEDTRIAAARANRTEGNFTTFESGVYTACEACKDDPKKPPLWQIKAMRIIHSKEDRTIYFEDARVEFFGMPLAYFPYFSIPDPTVKRKSGFLFPSYSSSTIYGYSIETPYFLALAPNYDVTLAPRVTTKQGLLVEGEYRQRLENGSFSIRAAGIEQTDPGALAGTPGDKNFRGDIESTGKFNINQHWSWGWDAIAITDPTFIADYKIKSLQLQTQRADPITYNLTEGITQVWLAGRGDRSYFDLRTIHYTGFSTADYQPALPDIHPVLDYNYTFGSPVIGGELSYKMNFTSLSRESASFDAITNLAVANNSCAPTTADPAAKVPTNCLLRGIPGDYSRLTTEMQWRRQIVDPYGQVFTPFMSLRADAATASIDNQIGVANYITPGDHSDVRVMPTIGMEYRYPFISVHSWGTQTLEPIAQVIARPNEPDIGKLPNEDSQSLVFDDSNLFKVDKFSGYDRIEGGGRANVGAQYTAQFNQGGFVSALFGQSYQLFGKNSFATPDPTNTGLGSGLDKAASDYVARVSYQPNNIYRFTSRFRFDQNDFSLQRLEIEGQAAFDRLNLTLLYGDYAAQPELGFVNRRNGFLTQASYKIDTNWAVSGALRYDIQADKISQFRTGIGYIDDCFVLGVTYIADYTYSTSVPVNHTFLVQFGLRTIGTSGFNQTQ